MGEDTQQFQRNREECFVAFGHTVSIRAGLALILTGVGSTLALASLFDHGIAIPSDFMVMWSMVLGYYFNKQTPSNGQQITTK